MRQARKNSITIEGLSAYLKDLVQMGFVSEFSKNGKLYYKLTEIGLKSGLKDLPKKKSQNGFEDNTDR